MKPKPRIAKVASQGKKKMQTNHVQKQEVQGQENGKTLFLAVKRETEKQVIIGAVYETKKTL